MKRLAKGIHRLGQRAAEIRQVVEAMPAQAAELREAVTVTAGQMRQLRTDLKAAVPPLLPTNESAAPVQLREIDESVEVLAEAGFLLAGIDCETGLGRRIRVYLQRSEAVPPARLRALLAAHAHQSTLKSLLAGIVQATDLAAETDLRELDFSEVVVEFGAGQSVWIGWRAEDRPAPAPAAAVDARPPTFSQSSFFAQPAVAPVVLPVVHRASATVGESPQPPAMVPAAAPLAPVGRASALDRFKKMPDLTKKASR